MRQTPDFPFVALHPGVAYCDSAATSLKSRGVLEAAAGAARRHQVAAGRGVSLLAGDAMREVEAARGAVARLAGVDDPRRVLFVSSVTEAMRSAASLLRLLSPGREAVVSADLSDHRATTLPWLVAAGGARPAWSVFDRRSPAGAPAAGPAPWAYVATVLHNVTGAAHLPPAAGAGAPWSVADAAQAGRTPLVRDVAAVSDLVTLSGHKIGSLAGVAALIVSGRLAAALAAVDLPAAAVPGEPFARLARLVEERVPDVPAVASLAAALGELEAGDREDEAARLGRLRADLFTGLAALPGVRLFSAARAPDCRHTAPLVTFAVRGRSSAEVGAYLDELGLYVRSGTLCTSGEEVVRVSFGRYNDEDDAARLVDAVRRVH